MTMRRLPAAMLCIAGLAGVLSACSSGTSLSPTTTPSTSSTATTTTTAAVPTVAHPLDSSKFQAAPCSALTTAQLEALSIPGATGDAGTDTLGPGCSWRADAHSGSINGVDLTWVTTSSTGLGLQFTYARKSVFKYWTTTTVEGYPAVIGDVMDDRANGSCTINVGVSDTMMFIADYNGTVEPQKSQSCQLVPQVADDIIKNLGG